MREITNELLDPEPSERAALVAFGGKLKPCDDPNIPHPGKVFHAGHWRTTFQIEKYRAQSRKRVNKWRKNNPEKYRKSKQESSRQKTLKHPGRSTPRMRELRNRRDQAKIDALLATNPWLKEALDVR